MTRRPVAAAGRLSIRASPPRRDGSAQPCLNSRLPAALCTARRRTRGFPSPCSSGPRCLAFRGALYLEHRHDNIIYLGLSPVGAARGLERRKTWPHRGSSQRIALQSQLFCCEQRRGCLSEMCTSSEDVGPAFGADQPPTGREAAELQGHAAISTHLTGRDADVFERGERQAA